MARHYVKVTEVRMKRGESLQVSLEEGEKIRKAKSKGTGSVYLKNHGNRMVDVAMIGDIEDISVVSPQETMLQTDSERLLDASRPEEVSETSSGYIKFLAGAVRLRLKFGKLKPIGEKLTEEQKALVNEQLKRDGVAHRV